MFFTYFNQVMSPGVDINLTLSKTQSGELVVILLPKMNGLKDDAQHRLGPLRLSGTPQELDREFFPSITAPVQKTSGILMNLAEYEKQQAAASAESKAAKEAKGKAAKKESDAPQEAVEPERKQQTSLFEAPPTQPVTAPAPQPPMAAPAQPAQGLGMFGPPTPQLVVETEPDVSEQYPEILDFPSGMRPPVYSGNVAAGAY